MNYTYSQLFGPPKETYKKLSKTKKAGRLRFFIPKHTHSYVYENDNRLQEQLDDGTWVDVPLVYEDY